MFDNDVPRPHTLQSLISALADLAEGNPELLYMTVRMGDGSMVVNCNKGKDGLATLETTKQFIMEHRKPQATSRPEPRDDEGQYEAHNLGSGTTAVTRGGAVVCIKCGQAYASLEDFQETVNRKGGCPACIHKEKWG